MALVSTDARVFTSFYKLLNKIGIVKDEHYKLHSISEINKFIFTHGGRYKDIIFVGMNPSTKSPDTSAFHTDTRSRKVLDAWIKRFDFNYMVSYENIHNKKTDKNISPEVAKIKMCVLKYEYESHVKRGKLIITLGNFAHSMLSKIGIEHFNMPHPSGLNRFWNNKEAGEAKIQDMIRWLKDSPCKRDKMLRY